MGDRANCIVHQNLRDEELPPVWLYTHWNGFELPQTVQAAMERGRNRWDDAAYLTRIIFDEMTAGQNGGETGFGISTGCEDNDPSNDFIVVDPRIQEVRFEDPETREVRKRWTFEDFCQADLEPEEDAA